jgi:hypothetical protein
MEKIVREITRSLWMEVKIKKVVDGIKPIKSSTRSRFLLGSQMRKDRLSTQVSIIKPNGGQTQMMILFLSPHIDQVS